MAKKRKKKHKKRKSKSGLNPKRVGLACGLFWAVTVMFFGLIAMFGWGIPIQNILSSVYRGYEPSIKGLIIGGLWALVDGFIGGYIFAWIWNWTGDKF